MQSHKPIRTKNIGVSARDTLKGEETAFLYETVTIDWQKAAPRWADIFMAIVLPVTGFVAVTVGLCLTAYWLVVPRLSAELLVIFVAAVMGALTLLAYLVRLRSNAPSTT